jgi:hypothetical protein
MGRAPSSADRTQTSSQNPGSTPPIFNPNEKRDVMLLLVVRRKIGGGEATSDVAAAQFELVREE